MDLDLGTIAVDATLIPIVVAIVQAAKRLLPKLVDQWVVVVSILAGVAAALVRDTLGGTFDETVKASIVMAVIIKGLIAGFAASGVYDVAKPALQSAGMVDNNRTIENHRKARIN